MNDQTTLADAAAVSPFHVLRHRRFMPAAAPVESSSAPSTTISTAPTHPANCLCCIGGPDLSFERAVFSILALNLGFEYDTAAKFIRLCRAVPRMVLSKGKAKIASKVRGKNIDALSAEEVQRVQNVVLVEYAGTLALEEKQRIDAGVR